MINDKIYTINEIKEKSKNVFQNADYVEKAYIFGSYARGEAKKDSDIDFMVCLNRDVCGDYLGLYPDLEDEFSKNVDVLTEKECMRIMPKSIERDAVMIYER